jgi:hypothetical protein
MKKIIGFISVVVILTAIGCSNKPAEVKKEVIVVPPTVIVKDPPENSTTVVVDKNGVKVIAKKVDVTVKKQ